MCKIILTVSQFAWCPALNKTPDRISNGIRTEWSPIWSVIIRVITKSDEHAAGVRFVYHDYRLNWMSHTKSYYQLIIIITVSEKSYEKGENSL